MALPSKLDCVQVEDMHTHAGRQAGSEISVLWIA